MANPKRNWPIFVLLGFVALFLVDVWFGGRILLLRDFFFREEQEFAFLGRLLRSGSFPLWSSLEQCGIPFAASPYNGSYYLVNWVFALPDVETAIRLRLAFHLILSALACYALARQWKMSAWPAMLAAVSFTFGTFMMGWMEFTQAMAWGILAFYFVSRIIEQAAEGVKEGLPWGALFFKNAGATAGLTLTLAFFLTSSGEFFYYSALLIGAYGVARWGWHRSWKTCGASLLNLAVAGILTLALAAPVLYTTLELMHYSVRSTDEVDALVHMSSAHPRQWLAMLLPFIYGKPGYPAAYWAPSIYEYAIGHCYIGILPLIGLFFAWLRPEADPASPKARERRFLVWFLVGAVLVSLAMAAGQYTPVYGFVHHWLPGMGKMRFPVKFFFITSLALAMLGGLGFQALIDAGAEAQAKVRRCWWVAAGFFGVFLLGFVLAFCSDDFVQFLMDHPRVPSTEQVVAAFTDYAWAALFSLAGLALFGLLAFRKGQARWVQAGIVVLAFLNMCLVSRQLEPTAPGGIYTRRPEMVHAKIGNQPLYRHWSVYGPETQQTFYGEPRVELWQWAIDAGATSHLQLEGDADLLPKGLYLNDYGSFFEAMKKVNPPLNEKMADLISMRYVIRGAPPSQILWGNASREISVTERPTALPRAFVASRWKTVDGAKNGVWDAIADPKFDPHFEVIVEPLAGQNPPAAPSFLKDAPIQPVTSFEDRGRFVSLQATAPQKMLLVLNDTWYPGWTVKVDGVEQPIYRANLLYRGVFLEPGTHRVEFSYWPTHYTATLCIFALALAACGALFAASRSQGRR